MKPCLRSLLVGCVAASACWVSACAEEQASQVLQGTAQQSVTSAQGVCRWLLQAEVDLKPVERARRLVATGELATLDAFWESLYASSVVLMVDSKSTQWASPKYPRIIKVMKTGGRNGPRLPRQLFSAAIQSKAPPFDDRPESMGERGSRDTVELQWFECGALGPQWRFAFVQVDESSQQLQWQGDEPGAWTTKSIAAPASARGGQATYTPSAHDHDPVVQARCTGCHGQQMLHPNFHDYPIWPGAIGSLGLDIALGHRSDRMLFSEQAESQWIARWLQAYRNREATSTIPTRMREVLERLGASKPLDSVTVLEQFRIDNDEYTSDLYSLHSLVVTAHLLRWLERQPDATTRVRNGVALYKALQPAYAVPMAHPPVATTPTGPPGDRHLLARFARETGETRFAAADVPDRYRTFASEYYDSARDGVQARVREHLRISTTLHSAEPSGGANSTAEASPPSAAVDAEAHAIQRFYTGKESVQLSVANPAWWLFVLRTLSETDPSIRGSDHDPLLERDWYPVLQPTDRLLHFDLNLTSDPYTADFRVLSHALDEWFKLPRNRRAASCLRPPK